MFPNTQLSFQEMFAGLAAGISVVTTLDGEGRPCGMTCTALVPLSPDPPSLVVSLDRKSSTLSAIEDTKAFAVNLLGVGGEVVSARLATKKPDKFDWISWAPAIPGSGSPVLQDGVTAVADCELMELVPVADHVLVVGRIISAARGDSAEPLLYYGRRTCYLTDTPVGVMSLDLQRPSSPQVATTRVSAHG